MRLLKLAAVAAIGLAAVACSKKPDVTPLPVEASQDSAEAADAAAASAAEAANVASEAATDAGGKAEAAKGSAKK
jgi:hypothetical protein